MKELLIYSYIYCHSSIKLANNLLSIRSSLLHFITEFCNGQIEESDSNVQPFLKAFNKKFDDCENHITLAIQMRNCNNAASVVKAIKTAVENYVLNGTSNETSRVRVLRFPSTA